MSEADALLAAIRQAPDDDAPRLIYADWLDEHGQPERAEFIRVQIELAQNESPTLRKRGAELLAAHHDLFVSELAAPGFRFQFERGFIVGFGHQRAFIHVEPEDNSKIVLRFFPTREVHGFLTGRADHEEIGWWIKQKSKPHLSGRYDLDPFSTPCKIALSVVGVELRIDYAGVFASNSIRLIDLSARADKPVVHEYRLLEIKPRRLDSRQDSP